MAKKAFKDCNKESYGKHYVQPQSVMLFKLTEVKS